jgi:hypothetical protein
VPDPQTADGQLETQIEELLTELKALLDDVAPLRERAAAVEAAMVRAQYDYEQKLRAANAEADRLELLKFSLLARLAEREPPPSPLPPTPAPIPPPTVIANQPTTGGTAADIPSEPPEAIRKRKLVAHIRYFTDDQTVIERINALLKDPRRDVGDMLELLPWGDLWRARAADWETLTDQWARLTSWRAALQERLAHWQREVRRLEEDDRHPLLVRKTGSSPEEWLAFLDELARKQKAENVRLAREVEVLQQQLAARASEEG